ncbi:MAG: tetratricopeptide repeat protein [Nannocystaceae bacterium]|nr:tetratricopeptide repeat protein [Nannocystaceae bacterium]
MKNLNRLVSLAAIGLLLSVSGCKGKDKGTTVPGGSSVDAAVNPDKASAEAKADFEKVVKRYKSAKAEGASLSKSQCADFSDGFMKVYKRHGRQMTVAWFNAGAVHDECGEHAKAEEIYKNVVAKVPKYDLSYNNLGVIYWNRRQEQRALDYFKKAVDANPATRAPRNNLAASLRNKYSKNPKQSDFDKAEKDIQRVLAVDSANRLAYENLARLYYDRGRLKDKSYLLLANLVIYQATLVLKKNDEKSPDLYNLKGLIYMERDNQVDALRSFKSAAEVNPKHADAHMNIAMISIRFRDYKQAEESIKIAMKAGRQSKNVEAYLGLGVAQRGLRKYKEAEKAFKKAMDLNGKDPRPLYNLGILYQEHIATAQEDFSKKPYETAKGYFKKFASKAGGDKELAEKVEDAKNRVVGIDQLFRDIEDMAKLQAEADKLEKLMKKQEAEERKRLLDIEARAKAAAGKAAADAAKTPEPKKEEPKK